jgi:hypothetical protein
MVYLLPLRRDAPEPDPDLCSYVQWLSARIPIMVVDGSPPEVFAAHDIWFGESVTHIPVDPDVIAANGKVSGVLTGLRRAPHDKVVIADDDVRYDEAGLAHMSRLLDQADLVRPQNYFWPLPWHARWDTARSLLNRALGADYPGTLGVRRRVVLDAGGYDGDTLFENLELLRTVEAVGGRVLTAGGFYVRRQPPTARHFWSQRVRQAYDSLAQPARLAVELAAAPTIVLAARRHPRVLPGLAGLAVAVAEAGRRRDGGTSVFPATCPWFAPAWVLERSVCSWLAVWSRIRYGGMPYCGKVIERAATPRRHLRHRLSTRETTRTGHPPDAEDGAGAVRWPRDHSSLRRRRQPADPQDAQPDPVVGLRRRGCGGRR